MENAVSFTGKSVSESNPLSSSNGLSVCSAFAAAYLIQHHNLPVRLALKRLRKKAKA